MMNRLHSRHIAWLLALLLAGCAGLAGRAPIERVVVFGDSNTDNGNLFRLTGNKYPAPPNWQGRNGNGPVVSEYVAKGLGVPLVNYSVSGASTGATNLVGRLMPAYKEAVETTGVRWQIDQFIAREGGKLGPNDLVILWAGSNDLYGIRRADSAALNGAITAAVRNVQDEIVRLHALGARRIVVGNRTPREVLENENDLNGIDFNNALTAAVERARSQTGADVRLFDAYGAIAEMMRQPTRYGFAEVRVLCITVPACATDAWEGGQKIARGYVNWDSAHKTTRVHELLGEAIVATARP